MKDEELLAEEYYYKTYPVTLNIGEEERKKEVTDIFLAGLKVGRPQWHDLRKDPTDLPEARPLNWVVAVYDGGILWCRARREKCVDGVYWVNSYHQTIENVVMWAKIEIPAFDKE